MPYVTLTVGYGDGGSKVLRWRDREIAALDAARETLLLLAPGMSIEANVQDENGTYVVRALEMDRAKEAPAPMFASPFPGGAQVLEELREALSACPPDAALVRERVLRAEMYASGEPGFAELSKQAAPHVEKARRAEAAALEAASISVALQQPGVASIQAAFRVRIPRPLAACWAAAGAAPEGGARRFLPLEQTMGDAVMTIAEEIRVRHFADETTSPERPSPFLPVARGEGEGAWVGLWLAAPRPDGDFAVLAVSPGEAPRMLALSSRDWVSSDR